MILFYAHGGGWGHLVRTRAYIAQHDIKEYKVMTSNRIALRIFQEKDLMFIDRRWENTPEKYGKELTRVFEDRHPEKIVVDVFPNGIIGELRYTRFPENCKKELLCRRMNWERYADKTGSGDVDYDLVRVYEELEDAHLTYLKAHGKEIITDKLDYPIPSVLPKETLNYPQGYWLVVHGGRQAEVVELCHYALKERTRSGSECAIVLLTEQRVDLPGIVVQSTFPARNWFSGAERIFTGGGFNCVHEMAPFRDKHTIMPFARKYDDQSWRMRTFSKQEIKN